MIESPGIKNVIILNMKQKLLYPILQAITAALLFGASAPLAKLLLGEIEPVALAAFLYLGSGIGLLVFKFVQQKVHKPVLSEAKLKKTDLGWLIGAIIAGGVAAPIIQLYGLKNTPGSTASLLLNFESVATTLIAALVFKEYIGRCAGWAILLITSASILLTLDFSGGWGISWGAAGILLACILWGVDNNFTRNIADRDPVMIVMIKGLAAGSFSLILAIILGNELPRIGTILKALVLGSLSYGVSITLFVQAMRGLGAARTSAFFGTAPLAGIGLSILILHEPPTIRIGFALPLMLIGTLLLVNEKHTHKHFHPAVIHEHAHRHDDGTHSHTHTEAEGSYPNQKHSHLHEHASIEHTHEHAPDVDHRHSHPS